MRLHARTAQLAMEKQGLPRDGRLGRSVAEVREFSQGALAEMRALIFELRPEVLAEEGVVAGLGKQAAALSARSGLPIAVDGPRDRLDVGPKVEEHLYRIVLEALLTMRSNTSAPLAQRSTSQPRAPRHRHRRRRDRL